MLVFELFFCVCKFTLNVIKFHLHVFELLSCLCEIAKLILLESESGLTFVPRLRWLVLAFFHGLVFKHGVFSDAGLGWVSRAGVLVLRPGSR